MLQCVAVGPEHDTGSMALWCVAVCCCSVSQCVTVCCSVLQCVAARPWIVGTLLRCSVLQCVAVRHCIHSALMSCSVLQCVCGSVFLFVTVCVWQCVAVGPDLALDLWHSGVQCVAVCYSVSQCVAVCCSVLQCVAVCCSVLQCVAVCCSAVCVCGSVLSCT